MHQLTTAEKAGEFFSQPAQPKSILELQRFAGIVRQIDDENKTITVSRQAINNHQHMVGIFSCIDEIRYRTSWTVMYQEDVPNDQTLIR